MMGFGLRCELRAEAFCVQSGRRLHVGRAGGRVGLWAAAGPACAGREGDNQADSTASFRHVVE